jgi:hypothetical protein
VSGWLQIVGWEKFQHYKDRRPTWIKNYVDLLRRDEYTDLTPAARAVLHGIWLLAASRPDASRMRAVSLSADLKMRVTRAHLESLNHAGFILLSASDSVSTLYKTASLETEKEKETLAKGRAEEFSTGTFGLAGEVVDITEGPRRKKNPDNPDPRFRSGDGTARYTGCTIKRGSHGMIPIRDPLGIDLPPRDWPYPPPTAQEIASARQRRAA